MEHISNEPSLQVRVASMTLRNPVMTASGTFGYGEEYADFVDLGHLGGIVVKGTTGSRREGNAYPRMAETPSGMLNAVGLQNVGVEAFCSEVYDRIKHFDTNVVVNVSGSTLEEYCQVAARIDALSAIPAIELNISCPNVKQGGMTFGTRPEMAAEVVAAVRSVFSRTLIVKLTPNVTNVVEIAQAVEEAGADSVSLINTLLGMAIDVERRRPMLSTITGGLSGPCVKPVAVRMVWQVAHAVKIPVIGLGGISTAADALEFLMAGARAVQVGTANFVDPTVSVRIVDGLADYCRRHHIADINDIVGIV
ncbi:MAG: dihydroorotate dehydrogenase [Bacteroidales bacterium]|nr:dihydroorotate dehydrogenase [Bacteroidales bacterium]